MFFNVLLSHAVSVFIIFKISMLLLQEAVIVVAVAAAIR